MKEVTGNHKIKIKKKESNIEDLGYEELSQVPSHKLYKSVRIHKMYDKKLKFYLISNEEINIHAVGKSLTQAKNNFADSLLQDYEMFRQTKDNHLSKDGIILKRNLIEIFEGDVK
jgi:hypothetical protein